MLRCTACDKPFHATQYINKKTKEVTFEDLCGYCKGGRSEGNTHAIDYQFGHEEEIIVRIAKDNSIKAGELY